MRDSSRVSSSVSFLSAMSAWSLILFGGLSLLVVCFSWDWAGALIGAALLGHGYWELSLRRRFLPEGASSVGKKLAWNQFGLAGSVLLYLSWQVVSFDRVEWDAMLARDLPRMFLEQFPPEVVKMLQGDFPVILAGAYGLAGFVVLFGCLGMALMYLKACRD